MSVKIRLQRHGKKGKPFFHIVVADSRARRDGRFIAKLGTYNPITNPATIELDVDAAVKWCTAYRHSKSYPFLQRCSLQKTPSRRCS